MKGPNFHEFLIRGANDRLLTDREDDPINPVHGHFVTLNNLNWQRGIAASKRSGSIWSDPEFVQWRHQLDYGIGRAPLELVAHVAENDIPYTEVLTADYIMANPMVAEGYGDDAAFEDASNPTSSPRPRSSTITGNARGTPRSTIRTSARASLTQARAPRTTRTREC